MAPSWSIGRALKWLLGIAVVAVVTLFGIGMVFGPPPPREPALAAAFKKAQATFPEFWARFEKPQADDRNFEVLARITGYDGESHEYVWMGNLKRTGRMVNGTVNSQARVLTHLAMGKLIGAQLDQLADWKYLNRGKIYGAATIRARLDKMPKEHADVWREMLAPE